MFKLEIIHSDGSVKSLEVPDECVAGSSSKNDIWLDSWRVGKQHARFMKTPSGVLVEDMGSYLGLAVNGMRVAGQHGPLTPSDIVSIGPFKLRVAEIFPTEAHNQSHNRRLSERRNGSGARAGVEVERRGSGPDRRARSADQIQPRTAAEATQPCRRRSPWFPAVPAQARRRC